MRLSFFAYPKMKAFKDLPSAPADTIDQLIASRELDRHPEMFRKIIEELKLIKMLRNVRNSEHLTMIDTLVVNRVLNFFEASCLGGFTVSERRIGVAAAILTSCVHVGEIKRSAIHAPQNTDTLVPVYLKRLQDYSQLIDYGVPEAEVPQIDRVTRLLMARNPSRSSMGSNRIAVFLVDASMAWITSGNQELIDFMIGDNFIRFKAAGSPSCSTSVIMALKDVTLPDKINRALNTPHATASLTQWGTARSFSRNTAQAVKSIRAKIAYL